MFRVIVLDTLSPEGLALLDAARSQVEYEVRTGLKGADLRQALREFDGAICRSGVKITAEALDGNRRLKAIVRGRRNRQHRQEGCHTSRYRGDEYAGRKYAQHGRARIRLNAGIVAQPRGRSSQPHGRQMGAQRLHGRPARRQDAWRRRPGTNRSGGRQAGPRLPDARDRLRSVLVGRTGRKIGNRARRRCRRCCRASIT